MGLIILTYYIVQSESTGFQRIRAQSLQRKRMSVCHCQHLTAGLGKAAPWLSRDTKVQMFKEKHRATGSTLARREESICL